MKFIVLFVVVIVVFIVEVLTDKKIGVDLSGLPKSARMAHVAIYTVGGGVIGMYIMRYL